MRRAIGDLTLIVATLLAISALAADPEITERRNAGEGCCRNWREDPAISGASRHGGADGAIHGGFLPVYRGGCWHWWYDQWVWVC